MKANITRTPNSSGIALLSDSQMPDSTALEQAAVQDERSEPITVLMTTDTVGGVLMYTVTLAAALQKFGIRIILAAMGGPLSEDWKDQIRRLDNVRCFESEYKLEWMDDSWRDVRLASRWLMRLADQFQPDIVHLNGYVHAALDWSCPTLVVGHSCVYSWYRDVQKSPPGVTWKKYYCGVKSGLKRADLVTAPTWSFLRTLRDIYGSFRTFGAIYNGLDPAIVDCPKEPFIFTAGRLWDQGKNIEILKKVQPLIRTPIYVAGSCDHPNGRSINCGLLTHVGLLTPDQIRQWYARAAVYVLPALYEPFGLSALEAAHAGCALVLGDIPSLHEVWANAALFVDPLNEHQIAQTLSGLMNDPARRDDYAKRAKQRALLYSADKMADRYRRFYSRLIKNEPAYCPAALSLPS